MSSSNNESWSNYPMGILTILLIVFLVWVFAGGRPLFRNTGRDLRVTMHDAGQDLKATGRDAASIIRDAVQ